MYLVRMDMFWQLLTSCFFFFTAIWLPGYTHVCQRRRSGVDNESLSGVTRVGAFRGQWVKRDLRLSSFSWGRRISPLIVSISIPKSVAVVVGGTVFWCFNGRFMLFASVLNADKALLHMLVFARPKNMKSSSMCTTLLTENLFDRIQCKAFENLSKVWQEHEAPIGRNLSYIMTPSKVRPNRWWSFSLIGSRRKASCISALAIRQPRPSVWRILMASSKVW